MKIQITKNFHSIEDIEAYTHVFNIQHIVNIFETEDSDIYNIELSTATIKTNKKEAQRLVTIILPGFIL